MLTVHVPAFEASAAAKAAPALPYSRGRDQSFLLPYAPRVVFKAPSYLVAARQGHSVAPCSCPSHDGSHPGFKRRFESVLTALVHMQFLPSSAHDSRHWTTNQGAPVWNNNSSLSVGERGPLLLEGAHVRASMMPAEPAHSLCLMPPCTTKVERELKHSPTWQQMYLERTCSHFIAAALCRLPCGGEACQL